MQGAINTRNTDILNSSIQGLDQLSLNKAETPVVSEIMAFAHEQNIKKVLLKIYTILSMSYSKLFKALHLNCYSRARKKHLRNWLNQQYLAL